MAAASMTQLLTPSPTSPCYSIACNTTNGGGGGGDALVRPPKRSGSDCDNIGGGGGAFGAISNNNNNGGANTKKGRLQQTKNADNKERQLEPVNKSSMDGSSCRSTPLTPLSSKSTSDATSNQDSMSCSSPNSPYQTCRASTAAAVAAAAAAAANSATTAGDLTFSHAQSYYQQPYYHFYPPLAAPGNHGYYQAPSHHQHQQHQSWAPDFATLHAPPNSAAAAAIPAYQLPLVMADGACGGPVADSHLAQYGGGGMHDVKDVKSINDIHGMHSYSPHHVDHHHQQQQQQQQMLHHVDVRSDLEPVHAVSNGVDSMNFSCKDECENETPSYYTKYVSCNHI